MAVIVPSAIAAAASIYKIASGVSNKKKADSLAASVKRPFYNIPQSDVDAQSHLASMATQGLSANTKQLAIDNADRGLSASLAAVLQGGGNGNDASKLYQGYMDNIDQLSMANDAAHLKTVDSYISSLYRQSDQEDKKFQFNQVAPYMDTQKAAAQMRGMGQGQLDAGINGLGGAAMSFASNFFGNSGATKGAKPAGYSPTGQQDALSQAAQMQLSANPVMIPNDGSQNVTTDAVPGIPAPLPFYGLDISKMKYNDALTVSQLWK